MSFKFNKFCSFDGGKTKKKYLLAFEFQEIFFHKLIISMLKTMTDIWLL